MNNLLQYRTERLPNYCYKLANEGHYGIDIAFADNLGIDEKRMSVMFPFADGERRDGVGDLLEIGGIKTERHRKNPLILFDHAKHCQLPIALAEDRDTGDYTVMLDHVSKIGSVNAFFYQGKALPGMDKSKEYEHAIFCEQLFDMVCQKLIRAGSIGYQVIRAVQLPPDYERGTPPGMHLLQTLMLEASLVVLPANGDTVRKMLSMPKCCGKPLSPYLVKSLEPYREATVKTEIARTGDSRQRQVDLKSLRMKYKDSQPVPLAELPESKVPPAKWKPGVGAVKSNGQKFLLPHKIKAIRVRYRNKLIRGFADMEMRFDTSNLDRKKQQLFFAEMEQAGFGRPAGSRWDTSDPPKLNSALKLSRFRCILEPGGEGVSESIRNAEEIAARHGVRLLGNTSQKAIELKAEFERQGKELNRLTSRLASLSKSI